MSTERNPDANGFDVNQLRVKLDRVMIHDQTSREMLRKQMKKGGIIHSDIVAFQNRTDTGVFLIMGPLIGALAAPVWGRLIKRPPLSAGKVIALTPFTTLIGAFFAPSIDKDSRDWTIRTLEDPARFRNAIAEMRQEEHRAAWIKAQAARPEVKLAQDGQTTQLAKWWDAGKLWQWRAQPTPASLDVSQIEVDFGAIRIHNRATREILRKQVEKGSITPSDIATFQNKGKDWEEGIGVSMAIGALCTTLPFVAWSIFIRRPPLSAEKMLSRGSAAVSTGVAIGGVTHLSPLSDAIDSLEDPPRFKQAVREMIQELEELKAASKSSLNH